MQSVIDTLFFIGGSMWLIVGLYCVYALFHLPMYLVRGRRTTWE